MLIFKNKHPKYSEVLETIKLLIQETEGRFFLTTQEELEYMIKYMTSLSDVNKQNFLANSIVCADKALDEMYFKPRNKDSMHRIPIFIGIVNLTDNFYRTVRKLSGEEICLLSTRLYNEPNEVIEAYLPTLCNKKLLSAIKEKAPNNFAEQEIIFDYLVSEIFPTKSSDFNPKLSVDESIEYIKKFPIDKGVQYWEAKRLDTTFNNPDEPLSHRIRF